MINIDIKQAEDFHKAMNSLHPEFKQRIQEAVKELVKVYTKGTEEEKLLVTSFLIKSIKR